MHVQTCKCNPSGHRPPNLLCSENTFARWVRSLKGCLLWTRAFVAYLRLALFRALTSKIAEFNVEAFQAT